MRVAVVELQQQGGLLQYAVQLGDALAKRGHEVDLLTVSGNELADRPLTARMRAVLTRPVRSMQQPRGRVAYFLRRAGIAVRLARAWARIVWETRPGARYDAVIVTTDLSLTLAAGACIAMTALPGRAALACVCHNVRIFNRWSQKLFSSSPLVSAAVGKAYSRFDLVFVHGERSRSEFESTWPPARLATIPHGDESVFADEAPPPSDEERILFFGDWRTYKGLPLLMEAFDELARRRPGARLTIAGTPSEVDGDPEGVRRWGAGHGDRVKLVDHYVPIEDVPAIFGEARVVATPYLVGYQSGVVHLAMTMSRAVVTSDVGDLPSSVIDGETGRVVPVGDREALVDALEEVVSNRELAERYGAEGRRRVLDRSSWDSVAEEVEAELLRLPRLNAAA